MRRRVPVCQAFSLALLALAACHHASKPATPTAASKVTLAVLPAESDAFPKAARAVTESLERASVSGVDERNVSKVSLEVVQLSIECVESTPACYRAVAKTLSANRLLFAQISAEKKKAVKVSVTLFDVDAANPRTAEKVYPNEKAATAGVGDLVSEATR
ncbi:MAG TPA: hypothetical protein VL326_04490 [Kofleriaceae bacterium]|nr:hypothetical protein [Kofleriaceae bacterium]